ncbi:MAG: hypothetical protein IPK07_06360 [Deltaproteobacteria bacterium]|nr:hypothetical protein [Deltaproteobacteria bacterium]
MNHPLLRLSITRGSRARMRRAASFVLVALALVLPVPVMAATIVVNSSTDVLNGSDGGCTLREALANADANAATYADCAAGVASPTVDQIHFSGVSSITLTGVELPISESVEIDGPVTIDGGGAGRSARILHVTAGTLTARDVIFQNAIAAGGAAILAANANLDLTDCTFDHNTASSSAGGAVSTSAGNVTLTRVTFTDNAAAAGDGGALWVSLTNDTLAVADGVFTDNAASNAGGALYVAGTGTGGATITGTSFLGNSCTNTSASKGGGAIYDAVASTAGTVISLSTFDSNVATAAQGGAIFNAASASGTTVTDTLFESNQAPGPGISQGFGGAIHNLGHLAVVTSSFHGNSAARSGAALSNRAAGSITVTLANSTIGGNTAGLSGGGVWNLAGSKIETRNVTVASNTIVSSAYGGANVWNDGAFTILNTIIADGIGTTGCGPTSLTNNNGDGNLQYPAASCGAGPAAIPAGDPALGTPAYDGGPAGLLVMSLGAGSAAIGAGNAATCAAAPISSLDQRGTARPLPVATTCDSGAYESGRIAGFSSSPVPGSTVPITVYAGSTDSGKVTVSETCGDAEITLASATSFTVADGAAPADVTVECTSLSVGVYTATLSIAHDGGASPSTYTVSCQVLPPPAPIYASSPAGGSTLDLTTVAGTPRPRTWWCRTPVTRRCT